MNITQEQFNTEDSIVDSVIYKFRSRSRFGKIKYGTTLDRNDLSTLEWLNHAQDEAMDFILYLERLKKEYNKKEDPFLRLNPEE